MTITDYIIVNYYTSLTSHWLKLNHMTWNNFNVLWKLTQTGNNQLRASKGKQLFLEVTLSSVCLQFGRTSRMAVANSSTSRFGKANENDINDILQSKD